MRRQFAVAGKPLWRARFPGCSAIRNGIERTNSQQHLGHPALGKERLWPLSHHPKWVQGFKPCPPEAFLALTKKGRASHPKRGPFRLAV
jgi:hypothetical protein